MEQYISKSALVAEIKKRAIEAGLHDGVIAETREDECYSILSLIDTLEVKEIGVDVGSLEGDIGVKTIWDGDKIVSNKAQKGE